MRLLNYFTAVIAVISFFSFQNIKAETYDEALRRQLAFFNVTALKPLPKEGINQAKISFGKRLFLEPKLSGNLRSTCFSCHSPGLGTSDGVPFSLSENGEDLIRRNAQSLYNMKSQGDRFYFWDGRIEFNKDDHTFKTPEPKLNGAAPELKAVVDALETGLAAQVIFPIVSREEMRGQKGENEVADEDDLGAAWDKVVQRIKNDWQGYKYLFENAFPGKDFKEMNIGHIGSGLAYFIENEFYSYDSPLNRFIEGDTNAMSLAEKRGLEVFMGKGRCIACHQGPYLGNNTFFTSVGVPELAPSTMKRDLGRFEVTGANLNRHFYKVPTLRNIGASAPYFHNGAKRTLREVVDHYNDIRGSIDDYKVPVIYERRSIIPLKIFDSPEDKADLFNSIQARFLKIGLGFTDQEKEDLVLFLDKSLSDPKFMIQ